MEVSTEVPLNRVDPSAFLADNPVLLVVLVALAMIIGVVVWRARRHG